MKYIYQYTIALIFCLSIAFTASAQREERMLSPIGDPILQERHTSEFTFNNPGDSEVGNIIIDYNNTTFINNHSLATRAIASDLAFEIWLREQHLVIKVAIEKEVHAKYGNFPDFPNFNEAQKWLYEEIELDGVRRNIGATQTLYKEKVEKKKVIRDRCLRNIKLLDFRANQISTGQVNNPQYGHLKLYNNDNTLLEDITNTTQLNNLRTQEVNAFTDNQWKLDQELKIVDLLNTLKAQNVRSSQFNRNNPLLQELYRRQLNHFRAYSGFDGLGLLQLSLFQYKNLDWHDRNGYVTLPPTFVLPEGYKHLRIPKYANSDYIGDYAIRNTPPGYSLFHPDYWRYAAYSEWQTRDRINRMHREREEALNNSLNEFDLAQALADAAIAGLGPTNGSYEDYINDRPTLKAEIENYFSLNDYSKLSHDCANYLLNQYLQGGQFTLGENYYASAGTPEFNSSFNPNIAIGTNLNAIAKRDEFTYLNNVLAALLNDSVHRPEYKGQIIREVFEANGINIPAGLDNATLANYFNFAPTAADSMRIDHARGHGVKTNLDQYLRDLKDFHNTVQDMLQSAPTGMNQVAYVDYENRIVEVLNFTNDADALAIADMFKNEIARNNYLQLHHHQAITDSAHDMLQAGFNEGLEFSRMAERDPEGLRIVTREAAEISAIDDIAEDVGQNGSSFWPRNAEEWAAFAEIMAPLLGEVLLAFVPGSDIIGFIQSLNQGDTLGASLAIAGLIVDALGLRAIRGAIKASRIFRKGLIITRKLGRALKAAGYAVRKGFKIGLDSAGKLVLKRGDQVIAKGADEVKRFTSLLEELGRSGVNHNAGDIIRLNRNSLGKIVFLETGNLSAGLKHILDKHKDDFIRKGIQEADIPNAVIKAATEGVQVGVQGTRPIFEIIFNGVRHRIAVTIGSNGFIVGANPVSF